MRNIYLAFLLSMLCGTASAQTTVPYTFSAGTTAQASQVNADFQALATAIDGLTATVNKLNNQLTSADVAGTYNVNGMGVSNGGDVNGVSQMVTWLNGTVTLNANGTCTSNIGGSEDGINVSPSGYLYTSNSAGGSGTWTLNGSIVTIPGTNGLPTSYTLGAGGRVLVGSSHQVQSSTYAGVFLMILSKQ
jgi:hypothetical protein